MTELERKLLVVVVAQVIATVVVVVVTAALGIPSPLPQAAVIAVGIAAYWTIGRLGGSP